VKKKISSGTAEPAVFRTFISSVMSSDLYVERPNEQKIRKNSRRVCKISPVGEAESMVRRICGTDEFLARSESGHE